MTQHTVLLADKVSSGAMACAINIWRVSLS